MDFTVCLESSSSSVEVHSPEVDWRWKSPGRTGSVVGLQITTAQNFSRFKRAPTAKSTYIFGGGEQVGRLTSVPEGLTTPHFQADARYVTNCV